MAGFAAELCQPKKTVAAFLKQALRILFTLRGSKILQKAVFERLWQRLSRFEQATPGLLVDGILETLDEGETFQEEACQAFAILHLHHALHEAYQGSRQADQWQKLLNQAARHPQSCYVEVVLRFALSCAHATNVDEDDWKSTAFPKLKSLQDAWGVKKLKEERVADVKVSLLLQYPDFWQRAIEIAEARAQSLTPDLLQPVAASLNCLLPRIINEELTVREMLRAGSLEMWKNPNFLKLLGRAEVEQKLTQMVEKVCFMRKFEETVSKDLPSLFPDRMKKEAREFAKFLHQYFMCASAGGQSALLSVKDLAVSLAEIDPEVWRRGLDGEHLQVSIDNVPSVDGVAVPSFLSLLRAIKMLRLANSEKYKPLQSIFQEVLQESSMGERKLQMLDFVYFLYKGVVLRLRALSELGASSEVKPQILCAIQKHWLSCTPSQLSRLLEEQPVASIFGGAQAGVADRLGEVLKGKQTAEFWKLGKKILANMCSTLSKKEIPQSFSGRSRNHWASLQALQEAFLSSVGSSEDAKTLTIKDLDSVSLASHETRELFDFLDAQGAGFDLVQRLVKTMAEVPGQSFFKVLLNSVQKGEHLATRLAELVEGALTQDTLASVERASGVFMPLCAAALSAMNCPVDANKFALMVGSEWSLDIKEKTQQCRSQADIGALLLSMLREAHRKHGPKLGEFLENLRSALRQGQLVHQKLEESSDDATAVTNTVHYMVNSGYLKLTPSSDAMFFEVTGIFEFNKDQVPVKQAKILLRLRLLFFQRPRFLSIRCFDSFVFF